MSGNDLSQQAHCRLDGEAVEVDSVEENKVIDQLLSAVTDYRETLDVPGSDVDRADRPQRL